MPTTRQRIAARINGSARRNGALGRPRTVVVTGASAGIGRAVAREFGSAGAHVALIARGTGGLQAAADEIKQTGEPQWWLLPTSRTSRPSIKPPT